MAKYTRFAVIVNGLVDNVILADPATVPSAPGAELVETTTAGPGWRYVDGEFLPPLPPVEPVPPFVSRFQARAALHQSGLLGTVEALMAAPETDPIARLAWADAQEFRRDSPTVAAMAAALGLTSEDLDNLFRAAAKIEV